MNAITPEITAELLWFCGREGTDALLAAHARLWLPRLVEEFEALQKELSVRTTQLFGVSTDLIETCKINNDFAERLQSLESAFDAKASMDAVAANNAATGLIAEPDGFKRSDQLGHCRFPHCPHAKSMEDIARKHLGVAVAADVLVHDFQEGKPFDAVMENVEALRVALVEAGYGGEVPA